MASFPGQIAVVTGATSGIGKAIALSLAEQGVSLCLVGRKVETLEAVAQNARERAVPIHCYQADLASDDEMRTLAADLERDHRHVDVLIHSAGVISVGSLEATSVEDFDWQYRTNVRAPYVLTKALLPLLKSRLGQVVFINSKAGLTAKGNVGPYAASKHALRALADSLRDEVNDQGVRVLSVFLGRTASPMQEAIHKMEGRAYRPELLISPDDVAAVVVNTLGLPRSAEVTDIIMRPFRKFHEPCDKT